MDAIAGLCVPSSSERAWEELVGHYGPALKARIGGVLRRCGVWPRPDHVEEIVQEVYCRLLAGGGRRLRRCRASTPGQVGAFLGKVAERVALDQLRAARALKRGGGAAPAPGTPVAWAPAGPWCGHGQTRGGGEAGQECDRAVDPGANPEEQVLSRERMLLFLERCGALAGRRDYRRNARILALAARGMSSGEIARALGGALSPRTIEGLLPRVRRDVAAHARRAAADL